MSKTLQARVAQEIRAEMGRQRVTGAELARRLTVSEAFVSRRLADTGVISLAELERIAAALDREVAHFFPLAEDSSVAGAA